MEETARKRRILIVDDDRELSMIVRDMLEDYGYEVTLVYTSEEAYSLLTNQVFQLILLDINLPRITGFEVCKELRKISTVPIIFASARTSENDRVTGLDIGGDDYLPKPYSLKELLSRVNSLIRRTYGFGETDQVYRFGPTLNIILSAGNRNVTKNGEKVNLSLKEFDLLAYMAVHSNVSLSKESLLREVWGTFSDVEISTVAVHIRWLREKLEDNPSKPEILTTVWGIGYMLCEGEKQ
jgi:DNA-binding response OmpR family regulator